MAPDVVARDSQGGATIRAVRLTSPLAIDGQLDEVLYAEVPSISDFVQIEPNAGAPATQQTEVWVSFDDDHIYISVRCWEAHLDRMVANEMRRDSTNLGAGDNIAFMFDTFYDARNSLVFNVNPIGGRAEGQVTNDREYNGDWNPVWDVAVGRFDGGWTVETALPFKSVRYRPGHAQMWGFNLRRSNRWKNEISFLKPMPQARGAGGLYQASLAATLVGLQAPAGSKNLDIKPYAIADVATDRNAVPPIPNDFGGDIGLDVKYGLTQNLTADFTYNTDFAQVEADEQQVNLTRFSLFFPEKREFFLENQGLFAFGGAGANLIGGSGDTPLLFHSRRIGLNQGREVPIELGGRLTGRAGAFSVGALTIQSDAEPVSGAATTNFTVVRVKRDVLRRSSIGAIFTGRSVSADGLGSAKTYGVDGTLAFYDNLRISTYWAATRTPGLSGGDVSYRGQFDYSGDRYGVQFEHLLVGDNFNPEVGFVRRQDMRRSFATFRFSPRPTSIEAIRKFSWSGAVDYIEDTNGRLESREIEGEFRIDFENGDGLFLSVEDVFELLDRPFEIAPGVAIPVGGYNFADLWLSYTLGTQRRLAGMVFFQQGGFFNGDKTTAGLSGGRVEVTHQLSVEPTLSFNWVDLPEGRFTTKLITARTTYTVTPSMFVSALAQYNSSQDSLGVNLRFRWEYRPGSELFVVFNEQRNTLVPGYPELETRAFVVKVNRLFSF